MNPFFLAIDPYLIWAYRLTGHAFVDFLLGTFVLAAITLLIGEFCISLVFLISRKRIAEVSEEVIRYQNLSVDAAAVGDKTAYHATNELANDAFGRTFFMQIAFSAAFVWPIFFALTWMGYRFADVEFRLLFTDYTVGYICVFIPLFIGAYLIFKRLKGKLPYFRTIKKMLDSHAENAARMKTFADVAPAKTGLPHS
jgi:hypothetical protein